jgi:hydroxyacylglutathione hydrolase
MEKISILWAFNDNYIYVIQKDKDVIVVDPGHDQPVLQYLQDNNLKLSTILLTHHHADHTGGAGKLKQVTGCTVIGPDGYTVDEKVRGGDVIDSLPFETEVIATPGHTRSHVVYKMPELKALFTGDTLFIAGCGRLFEGNAEQMWRSLQKLSALQDDTKVHCGHEYTEHNLRFAATVDPDNRAITEKLESVRRILAGGGCSVPSTIAEEKEYNPFLRAHDVSIRKHLNMESAADVDVFTELRKRKDCY